MQQVKIYTASPSDLSPPVQSESFCVDLVLASDYRELEAKCAALVVENGALKKSEVEFNDYCRHECEDVGDTWVDDFTETPATDAFLAEMRAQAHKEGAYFVANRMLAAWDAGFIDDTAKNAADIARMIL
ncbi:ead/Ea22-like family protein, partial [Salmonella enterica]|nr:ead/Ea22-like family protein [Salmonella enterica]